MSQGAAKQEPSKEENYDLSKETVPALVRLNSTIIGYIEEFGFDVQKLDYQSMSLLVAARHVEHIVEKFKIPMATRKSPSDEKILVEKEVEKVIERTDYLVEEEPDPMPADRMTLAQIDEHSDLPKIIPQEWLIEEVAPEVFLKKLSDKELLKYEWQKLNHLPVRSYETVKAKELVEEPAPPKIERQHALVLLDVSGSMDGVEGMVAKALALAFLRRGYHNDAALHLQPFDHRGREVTSGSGQEGLHTVAKAILNVECDGGDTNIHGALIDAVAEVKKDPTMVRADILLMSDGLSYLAGYDNPLQGVKLHTLLIGDSLKRFFNRDFSTLKNWSETLTKIGDNELDDILQPTENDIQELIDSLHALPDQIDQKLSYKQFFKMLKQIEHMAKCYKESLWYREKNVPKHRQIDFLMSLLAETMERFDKAGFEDLKLEYARKIAEEERKKQDELEARQAQQRQLAEQQLNALRNRLRGGGGALTPQNMPEDQNQPRRRGFFAYIRDLIERFRKRGEKESNRN